MLPAISLEEFESCPWKEALDGIPKHSYNYMSALNAKAKEYGEDSAHWKPLNFLSALTGMMLNVDGSGPVFKPMFEFSSGHSPLPESIPQENFEPLFNFAVSLDEPILRARIMDVLWVRRIPNKVSAAKHAISAYLECASTLAFEPIECIPYLKRALNITYELGKTGIDLREGVSAAFEQALKSYNRDELNGLHHKLLYTMAERKIGNQEELYALTVHAAGVHEAHANFHLMRGFLDLAKIFAKNANHPADEINAILVREAESYVDEAHSRDNFMAQAHFIEQAIQAYRIIGGHESRVEALHKEMLAIQKRIPELLTETAIDLPDMSDVVDDVQKFISGKGIIDALFTFVMITTPLDPTKERLSAVERAKKFPLSTLFSQSQMDKNGKTISKAKGISTREVTGDEPAIYADMLRKSPLNIHLDLYSKIFPALEVFLQEHEVTDILLSDLIKNNQLVPQGREMFFLRGLKAGFEYDFVTSSLYLIPQLENSIRSIMERNGEITSKLTFSGLQREKDLNDLFEEEFVKNLFGDKYIYTLKALLTEQEGANLRNRLAHGLAEYDQLQGDAAAYFWWLILRLLLTPFIQQQKISEEA